MSSKKILIAVIAMVVLLGAAIAGYVAVDHAKHQEEESSYAELAALQLFHFDDSAVTSVTIDNEDGHFRVDVTDDGWKLTETDYPHDILLNTYYITSLVGYMCDLTAQQKIDVAPDQRGAYGLDTPTVITCSLGNVDYTISVGAPSVTEEYWYVMVNDTVYSIDYTSGEILRGGMQFLKDRYMLHFHDTDITAFRIVHGNEVVLDITKPDGLWVMNEPETKLLTDSAMVGTMLASVTRRELSGFEAVAEDSKMIAQYGLDNPEYTLTVGCGDETAVLLFATVEGTGGDMYVLDQGTGQIARMDGVTVDFLRMQPQDLLSKKLVHLPFSDAQSLEVQVDDLAFTMQIDAAAEKYVLDSTDLSGTGSNITGLFRNLYDTVGNLEWEALDFDAQLPEDAAPDCTFRFKANDGTETELTLYQTAEDENLYYAFLNGEFANATVRRRSLTGTTGVLNFFEKLTDELEVQGIAYTPQEVTEAAEETSEETESDASSEPAEESAAEESAPEESEAA